MVPYMAYRWLWCSSELGNLSQDKKSEIKIIESLSPSIKEGNFVESAHCLIKILTIA